MNCLGLMEAEGGGRDGLLIPRSACELELTPNRPYWQRISIRCAAALFRDGASDFTPLISAERPVGTRRRDEHPGAGQIPPSNRLSRRRPRIRYHPSLRPPLVRLLDMPQMAGCTWQVAESGKRLSELRESPKAVASHLLCAVRECASAA